jgi:putative PIN family toxin of toxin-antitoxin system
MSTAPKRKPEKIVVDTNILVSIYIFPGTTVVRILDLIKSGKALLGVSAEILGEFVGVCIAKFRYEPHEAISRADAIRDIAEIVEPVEKVDIIKDTPDNRILECAAAFGADCIISGDKHLLELKKYKGIEILTPADYIRKYG